MPGDRPLIRASFDPARAGEGDFDEMARPVVDDSAAQVPSYDQWAKISLSRPMSLEVKPISCNR
jgi:hypothetical protein